MTKDDIQKYFEGTGYNASDLKKKLKEKSTNGYDISCNESLGVFYFGDLLVVVDATNVSFYQTTK